MYRILSMPLCLHIGSKSLMCWAIQSYGTSKVHTVVTGLDVEDGCDDNDL